jgi:hypothetical protein
MRCYNCQVELIVHSPLLANKTAPVDGDYSICAGCKYPLVFEGCSTRAPTLRELREVTTLLQMALERASSN